MGHVDPDLVGAPRLEGQAHEGLLSRAARREDPVAGEGALPVRGDDPGAPGPAEPCDGGLDDALRLAHASLDQRPVLAIQLVGDQLLGELLVGVGVAGEDHQPRGVAVDPVHRVATKGEAPGPVVVGEPVGEGAVVAAMGGVDHDPRGLVEHDEVLVLVEDGEGHRLGVHPFGRGLGEHELQGVALVRRGVNLDGHPVEEDAVGGLEAADEGPRGAQLAGEHPPDRRALGDRLDRVAKARDVRGVHASKRSARARLCSLPKVGKVSLKREPLPASLSTSMLAWCFSRMPWQMLRPSPVPLPTGLVVKKGSKMWLWTSSVMPSPLSWISIWQDSPA
ncbi:hypothetical protein D3C86_1439560 [compost metagenome]